MFNNTDTFSPSWRFVLTKIVLFCLSRHFLHYLVSQILPVSLKPFSWITYPTSSIFLFLILFLLSLPWSIPSGSHYNTLLIFPSLLFSFLYLLVLILLGTSSHKRINNCSQLDFISLNFKRNGNSFEDFRVLPQETTRNFLMHISARFVKLLIELTVLLAVS